VIGSIGYVRGEKKLLSFCGHTIEPTRENSIGSLDSEMNPKYALPNPEKKLLRFIT